MVAENEYQMRQLAREQANAYSTNAAHGYRVARKSGKRPKANALPFSQDVSTQGMEIPNRALIASADGAIERTGSEADYLLAPWDKTHDSNQIYSPADGQMPNDNSLLHHHQPVVANVKPPLARIMTAQQA